MGGPAGAGGQGKPLAPPLGRGEGSSDRNGGAIPLNIICRLLRGIETLVMQVYTPKGAHNHSPLTGGLKKKTGVPASIRVRGVVGAVRQQHVV